MTAPALSDSAVGGGRGGAGGDEQGSSSSSSKLVPLPRKRSGFLSPSSPSTSPPLLPLPPPSYAMAATARGSGSPSPSSSSAIALATAAAIAAGPLALGASSAAAGNTVSVGGGGGGAIAAPLPLLEVRGCTPIGLKSNRFEINLGQQLAHPSSLEWPVFLMWPAAHRLRRGSNSSSMYGDGGGGGGGSGGRRIVSGGGGLGKGPTAGVGKAAIKFKLYTLHTSDAEWLTLGGPREGQLREGGCQVKTLDTADAHVFVWMLSIFFGEPSSIPHSEF